MRYAVINTRNDHWGFKSDEYKPALEFFKQAMAFGLPCVLVKVLADSADEDVDIPSDKEEA